MNLSNPYQKIGSERRSVLSETGDLAPCELRLSYVCPNGKIRYHCVNDIKSLDVHHLVKLVKKINKENDVPMNVSTAFDELLLDIS